MKTTTVSSATAARVGQHAGSAGRRDLARYTAQLIGTLAINAALLLVGLGLTGFAWQALCFLLLPPMVASVGAGFTFLFLNRMALQPVSSVAVDSLRGRAHVVCNRRTVAGR
jgi:hypothetical protein